jgi:hypothetical protein
MRYRSMPQPQRFSLNGKAEAPGAHLRLPARRRTAMLFDCRDPL